MNNPTTDTFFGSQVYSIDVPDHLAKLKIIFEEEINKSLETNKVNESYPVAMTSNLQEREDLSEFMTLCNQLSYEILTTQGYDLQNLETYTTAIWGQRHFYLSNMEEHSHAMECDINAFYILSAPENCCKLVVNDPRIIRLNTNRLPIKPGNASDIANNLVWYTPTENKLYLTNSWLSHKFTKNENKQYPFDFFHMNINCFPKNNPPIVV